MRGGEAVHSASSGSSPRVWGRFISEGDDKKVAFRFIPTRVGQIPHQDGRAVRRNRFIPTRVGQMPSAKFSIVCNSGSSPRVWGRLSARFMPLCTPTVHPHACGADDYILHTLYTFGFGSSPRVWGRWAVPCKVKSTRCGSSPRVWGRWDFPAGSAAASPWFIPTRVGQILPQMQL